MSMSRVHTAMISHSTFWCKMSPLNQGIDITCACTWRIVCHVADSIGVRPRSVVLEDPYEEMETSTSGLYNASSEETKSIRRRDRTQCVRWLSSKSHLLTKTPSPQGSTVVDFVPPCVAEYFSLSKILTLRIESVRGNEGGAMPFR